MARVLIACEFSGVVSRAFRERGHTVWSCDLLPTEDDPAWHIQADAIDASRTVSWDLMIAHPPCTHLAVSGARWFHGKRTEQEEALEFVRALFSAPIPRICIENPVSIISSRIRKPTQTIQPWQFGHPETKATCLWLKGLRPLVPTHMERLDLFAREAPTERTARVHREPPGPDRWKNRSRSYQQVADAMADQWG